MLCLGLPFLPLHIALLVDLLKLHVCFPAISNWRIKGAKGNIRCKSHESHVGSSFHVSKYNRFQTTCKSSGTHFNSAVAEAAAAAEQSRWQLAFLPKTFASVDIEKNNEHFHQCEFWPRFGFFSSIFHSVAGSSSNAGGLGKCQNLDLRSYVEFACVIRSSYCHSWHVFAHITHQYLKRGQQACLWKTEAEHDWNLEYV